MRMLIRGAVALVILIAAYWGWALVGAAELASAASRGDAEAVMERVDLQALIRSLSSQISRAYLDQNPQLRKLLSQHGLAGGFAVNAAAAEMLLRAFLTPENIAALLNQERVGVLNAGGKDAGTVRGMPSLGEAFHARPLQVLMHSHFDGPLSFVVGLDSPDGRYRVHMKLSGMTWRLSGLDMPAPITARLARLIAQRIGGAIRPPRRLSRSRPLPGRRSARSTETISLHKNRIHAIFLRMDPVLSTVGKGERSSSKGGFCTTERRAQGGGRFLLFELAVTH